MVSHLSHVSVRKAISIFSCIEQFRQSLGPLMVREEMSGWTWMGGCTGGLHY
jgi:hypothetical protein